MFTLLFSTLAASALGQSSETDQPAAGVVPAQTEVAGAQTDDSAVEMSEGAPETQAMTTPHVYGFMQSHSLISETLGEERGCKIYLPASYYAINQIQLPGVVFD